MTKSGVIEILQEIAVLLELLGENPFKARAYLNAVRVLENQTEEVDELVHTGKLAELPGFGEALTEKVTELVTTGKCTYYNDLKKKVPAGLLEMIRIPGLGPKKAKSLYDHLKIDSIEKLKKACLDHRVSKLEGFGEKTEAGLKTVSERISYGMGKISRPNHYSDVRAGVWSVLFFHGENILYAISVGNKEHADILNAFEAAKKQQES